MYLRTTKRRNADGSEVCYYQLADNVWDPQRKCSVAKVVYNFGRGDELDAEKASRITSRGVMRPLRRVRGALAVVVSSAARAWA